MEDCKCFNRVTHIIFDLDGTLVDTEFIYEKLFSELVSKYGKFLSTSMKFRIQGSPASTSLRFLIEKLELPITFEDFSMEFKQLVVKRLCKLKLMKGAQRLIQHFHRHNIPMAIGTSSDADLVELKTSSHSELFKLIHHIVTATDVLNGKPSPDIFLLAAKKFPDHPRPEMCLVFEDSPNGVEAARAANMQCVMIPDERIPTEQRQQATLALQSLADFQPETFGLPPFDE